MSEAERQPKSGEMTRATWIVLAVAIAFAVVAVAFVVLTRGPDEGDAVSARRACHEFVEKQLKSPRSADFGGELTTNAERVWSVNGSVDSENSFGAKVRNSFTCKATYTEDGDWLPTDVQVSNN